MTLKALLTGGVIAAILIGTVGGCGPMVTPSSKKMTAHATAVEITNHATTHTEVPRGNVAKLIVSFFWEKPTGSGLHKFQWKCYHNDAFLFETGEWADSFFGRAPGSVSHTVDTSLLQVGTYEYRLFVDGDHAKTVVLNVVEPSAD